MNRVLLSHWGNNITKKVDVLIIDEVKSSDYLSLSVDSPPDLLHIEQVSVILQHAEDGKLIERLLTFVELQNHTSEGIRKQVLQYLCEVCKLYLKNAEVSPTTMHLSCLCVTKACSKSS